MAGKFQSPGKKPGFSLPQKPTPGEPKKSPEPKKPAEPRREPKAITSIPSPKPKPEPPRELPAAEPLNHEQARIQEWLRTVRFRRAVVGGVDEADLWRKLQELNALYEAALSAERARYDALLAAGQEAGNHG